MTETFADYTARLIGLAGNDDPTDILAATPARIGRLIARRSTADLQRSPGPGRWSIAQIVAHLADAEIVFGYRARMILASPGTAIQAFDQDAFVRSQHAETSDAFESLSLFASVRTATLRLFRGLNDEELDRFGIHAERGKETLRHLRTLYAGHDRNHLAQIEGLAGADDPARAVAAFSPAAPKAPIDPAVLERLDVRAGTIRAAVPIPAADRLALLTVSFDDRVRTIVAGIRTERPSLEAIVGRQALFVLNLPPKTLRGHVSEGMLFDIGFADGLRPAFAVPEWPVPDGVRAG